MLINAFLGVLGLGLVYLSTGCCSLYVPNSANEQVKINITGNQKKIQICGSQLTNMIMFICEGYVNSPTDIIEKWRAENPNSTETVRIEGGVAQKCCKNQCDFELLMEYCLKKPDLETLLQSKGEIEGVGEWAKDILRTYVVPSKTNSSEAKTVAPSVRGKNETNEDKVRRTRKGKKPGKFNKFGKSGFKERKSLYKNFGHFLLNLDPSSKFRNIIRKRKNVETFEIGTIKPETLGGNPLVVRSLHTTHNGELKPLTSSKIQRKRISAQY